MQPVKVSVIIVSVNHPELLGHCLDSLRKWTTATEYETWVVAHRFTGENLSWLRAAHPWVRIIESGGTKGFSENNNLALERANGEYCFLLNDDTLLESPVVDRLAADLDSRPEIAMISPVLVCGDGRVQFKGSARMTAWRWFLREMRWNRKGRKVPAEEGGSDNPKGIYRTYHLMGAALMARRKVLDALGRLDERFFFGPEDTALTEKANANGYGCYIDGDVRLPHLKSESLHHAFIPVMMALQRGYILYYGRGSFWARCRIRFLARVRDLCKLAYWSLKGKGENAAIHRRAAWALFREVGSRKSPKELFESYRDNLGGGARTWRSDESREKGDSR